MPPFRVAIRSRPEEAVALVRTLGRKVIAVSGDRKIEAFMEAAGLGNWVLDREDIDLLPQRLASLPDQPDRSEFVQETQIANEAVAAQIRALVQSLVAR